MTFFEWVLLGIIALETTYIGYLRAEIGGLRRKVKWFRMREVGYTARIRERYYR